MQAVLFTVRLLNPDAAGDGLRSSLIPMLEQQPGFVGGVWYSAPGRDDLGRGLTVWEDDAEVGMDTAQAQEGMESIAPGAIEILSIEAFQVDGTSGVRAPAPA